MDKMIWVLPAIGVMACGVALGGEWPEIPAISDAMRGCIEKNEIPGAVTLVATPDKIVHCSAVGCCDLNGTPMRADAIFWIASMTKPVTATAILMLQDEGKLSVDDAVSKYIPELADVKTVNGQPGNLTLRHLLTHTSGLAEATGESMKAAKTLADLIPVFAKKPLQFKPGTKWQYCQSGINSLGRIIEVVSGQSLPEFFRTRLFEPLGMRDTTFYPTAEQLLRIVHPCKFVDGKLVQDKFWPVVDPTVRDRFPAANGGLYSTAGDYARFCQMILSGGSFGGKQFISPPAIKLMTSIQTGDLQAGFLPGSGWGLAWGVVREPQGLTAMLSPGTYGHGGAFGTQAWIDPVKQRIYLLMIQRSNFPNSDGSPVRLAFQTAAAASLK